MNLIDYHVVSTAVMCGLGIMFVVSVFAGVLVTITELFNEKDDE